MQIECPSCGRSSELPDHLIGDDGKDLTCPSCSAAFTVLPGGWTTQPDASGSADGSSTTDAQAQAGGGTPSDEPGQQSPFVSQGPAEQGGEPSGSPPSEAAGFGSGASSSSGDSPTGGQQAPSGRMPDLEPGTVLSGQYRIESKIGRGAVATVYTARDTELDENIALKAIPTFGNTEAAKRAVLPEYKAVRRLKSSREHILHIDRPTVCEHSGMDLVLLPMERAEKSFRDWLEETEADPGVEGRLEEGLALLRQACRGVEALHEQGLAHMDLKPENLLLTKDRDRSSETTEWTVKVADFGLARSLRRGEVLNEEVVAEGVGTPYYMAPEQVLAARQEEIGQEADLYALGIILFELLDGKVPFDGSAKRVREKHRTVEPPPVRTNVPGRLEALAHECLAKEAGDRPPGAGAIREELTLETREELEQKKGERKERKAKTITPLLSERLDVSEEQAESLLQSMLTEIRRRAESGGVELSGLGTFREENDALTFTPSSSLQRRVSS